MEDTDGGLHPAVDGQSLDEDEECFLSWHLSDPTVSAQDGIVAFGKAHTRSALSLSSLPKVALETVPIFV